MPADVGDVGPLACQHVQGCWHEYAACRHMRPAGPGGSAVNLDSAARAWGYVRGIIGVPGVPLPIKRKGVCFFSFAYSFLQELGVLFVHANIFRLHRMHRGCNLQKVKV